MLRSLVLCCLLLGAFGAGCDDSEEQDDYGLRANLEDIYRGAVTYYDQHGERFPEPSVGPTFALGDCCFNGGVCPPWPDFDDPTWGALSFSVGESQPFHFLYTVVGNPGAKDGSNCTTGNLSRFETREHQPPHITGAVC